MDDGGMKTKAFLKFQDKYRTLKILRTKIEIGIYFRKKKYILT